MTDLNRDWLKHLPDPLDARVSGDVDAQARAALAILVRSALESAHGEPRRPDPTTCPNCGAACDSDRTPYCSEACKETSAFVRQLRGNLESGALLDPERQIALGEKFWWVLGGGRPRRVAMIPERSLARVLGHRKGACEVCGEPAITVDHCGSG